jgi:hypothetical protein
MIFEAGGRSMEVVFYTMCKKSVFTPLKVEVNREEETQCTSPIFHETFMLALVTNTFSTYNNLQLTFFQYYSGDNEHVV